MFEYIVHCTSCKSVFLWCVSQKLPEAHFSCSWCSGVCLCLDRKVSCVVCGLV